MASILTYEVTAGLALFAWIAYAWLGGWRAALPRMALDIPAVAAAAIYTREHTNKSVESLAAQLGHVPDIARDGADVIAGALLPVWIPADISPGSPRSSSAARWRSSSLPHCARSLAAGPRRRPGSAGRSWQPWRSAALALSWAIFVPQAFYTPTFRGIEDRVNIVALYPAVVLVWAVLRSAGSLLGRNGYRLAVAGAVAVAIGYWIQDFRQQDHWLRSTELQPGVLAAVERADARMAPSSWSSATRRRPRRGCPSWTPTTTSSPPRAWRPRREIDTYPVFTGSTIRCSPKGIAIDYLATPLYDRISVTEEGTAKLQPYSNVVFVDVADETARADPLTSAMPACRCRHTGPARGWIAPRTDAAARCQAPLAGRQLALDGDQALLGQLTDRVVRGPRGCCPSP